MTGNRPSFSGRYTSARSTSPSSIPIGTSQSMRIPSRTSLFVEMSTVRPETERTLAAKIRAKGAAMIECPVGGTIGPAKDGKLFGFVGGETADVARAKPLLGQMCRRIEHVGPVGAGASMKL